MTRHDMKTASPVEHNLFLKTEALRPKHDIIMVKGCTCLYAVHAGKAFVSCNEGTELEDWVLITHCSEKSHLL